MGFLVARVSTLDQRLPIGTLKDKNLVSELEPHGYEKKIEFHRLIGTCSTSSKTLAILVCLIKAWSRSEFRLRLSESAVRAAALL